MDSAGWTIHTSPRGRDLLQQVHLDLQAVFTDPRITVWRDLPERQNCYLDSPAGRLHIKRYKPPHAPDAIREAKAISLLESANIPTVPLLAWGVHTGGNAFLITEDLSEFAPADKLIASQAALADQIAQLALKLHTSGLHHRDLYLCHFFVHPTDSSREVRLIDPGRVARLPRFPMNLRWIVKDVAQLIYSADDAGLPERVRNSLLETYLTGCSGFRRFAVRVWLPMKVASIARHDRKLREKTPGRRVSIDPLPNRIQ